MTKRFVLVAGNIGTGKTSLTERLGERLGWITGFESVQDNPYLADFYQDMHAWAFHLQVFFLGHRARQHLALARAAESAIVDRSIYEDAEIFARTSLDLGNIAPRDYQAYRSVYELVLASLPAPDLLLHLRAPVSVLLRRIRDRARPIEAGVTETYLALLEQKYEQWLAAFDLCPVLTLRTDDLDFVHQPQHLEIVIDRMQAKFAGREEVLFPPP
ncbi:MAG TPA: deoxynucleoside kinase [Anaerolineales bacterium]|nr:deoxynucleoside kinase [Anaerolineales bacterium]